ncbi:MAG: SURF1 family protein [Actinomycetota bacterium]
MASSRHWFLRPRWIVATLLVIVVAGVCARLGVWQLDRLEQRRALNARVETGLRAPPAPLEEVLASSGAAGASFHRATVTGSYDRSGELILFGRTLDGRPGNHVLTPLRPDTGGMSVLVDRGWVPIEIDRPEDEQVAPPQGEVSLTGILVPSEEEGTGPDANGTVGAIDVDAISASGAPLVPGIYLRLQEQLPPQPDVLPEPVPLPPPTEGPHLSYAVQWFIFAMIAVIGYAFLLRKTAREERTRVP